MELADAPKKKKNTKNWTDGVLEELEYWRALQDKKNIFMSPLWISWKGN